MTTVYCLYTIDYSDYEASKAALARADEVRAFMAQREPAKRLAFDAGELVNGLRTIEFSGDPQTVALALPALPARPDHVVVDANEWAASDLESRELLLAACDAVNMDLNIE